jgi:hypothetical protein
VGRSRALRKTQIGQFRSGPAWLPAITFRLRWRAKIRLHNFVLSKQRDPRFQLVRALVSPLVHGLAYKADVEQQARDIVSSLYVLDRFHNVRHFFSRQDGRPREWRLRCRENPDRVFTTKVPRANAKTRRRRTSVEHVAVQEMAGSCGDQFCVVLRHLRVFDCRSRFSDPRSTCSCSAS